MVNEYGPGTTLAATTTLSVVDVVPDVTAAGLNDAVIPVGTVSVERFTVPEKLPVRAMVAVTVPVAPCATESVLLDRETVKPGVTVGGLVPPSPHAASVAAQQRASEELRNDANTRTSRSGLPRAGMSWRQEGVRP